MSNNVTNNDSKVKTVSEESCRFILLSSCKHWARIRNSSKERKMLFHNEWIICWSFDQWDRKYIDPSRAQCDSPKSRILAGEGKWWKRDQMLVIFFSFLNHYRSILKKNEMQRWTQWGIDLGWSKEEWRCADPLQRSRPSPVWSNSHHRHWYLTPINEESWS